MAADLTNRADRRRLRELASLAHSRELAAALSKLEEDFARWRSGGIDPFELNDRIHRFHDETSQSLYARYRDLPPEFAVARGLALNLLKENEIPYSILKDLGRIVQFCREQAGGNKPDGKAPRSTKAAYKR